MNWVSRNIMGSASSLYEERASDIFCVDIFSALDSDARALKGYLEAKFEVSVRVFCDEYYLSDSVFMRESTKFLYVNVDFAKEFGDAVTICRNIRLERPDLPLIVSSAYFSKADYSPERSPIADASLKPPYSERDVFLSIIRSAENNIFFQDQLMVLGGELQGIVVPDLPKLRS